MKNILFLLVLTLIFEACFDGQTRISVDHASLSKIRGVILFDDSPFSGVLFSVFSNGSKNYEQEIFDGKKHGTETMWYPNSQVRSVSEFSNGILNGTQKEWYQNGKPSREMKFVGGKQDGLQIGWEENGDLRFKYTYLNGKRYGFMGSALCQAPE